VDSEYARDINEFRYEEQVAEGLIAVVGNTDPYLAAWWCPDPRPVIGVDGVHLGRNVRKQLRRSDMRTTANHSFVEVAEQCRAEREPRWLTDTLLESMAELHREGWAHSIEVWLDDDLIGGALGVGIGPVLSGDSIFGHHPEAGRVAVADMAARFAQAGGLTIDAQWDSPYLRSLGAEMLPRDRYLRLLTAPAERTVLPAAPLPARRLIDPAPR
jgi:leucyl/phenylalanyl-tRNA--protein transferase